jgi:glucose/arabinose dehydrogenase
MVSSVLRVIASAAAVLGTAAQAQELGIRFVPVVSGLAMPVAATHAGDNSGRLFVTEQAGLIRIVRNDALLNRPFLDISGRVSCCGEQGLLSVAFPPSFPRSSAFYVNYTDTNGDTTVARYRVSSDPDLADPTSEEIILKVAQPYSNHNGGQLAFGPDGYLYIGMGDGGSGGDPQNRAQDPSELLGKLLRIDVESGATPYAVPLDNPFRGDAIYRPEIWALGLRNPWRFSFDRVTGDLWIGDVGQNTMEEIDHQLAASHGGENYGWRIREGTLCYDSALCATPGLVPPVAVYTHSQGCSVTGGYVYRGERSPAWVGTYFFGDFCTGLVWALRPSVGAAELIATTTYAISSFGEDERGEIYLVDYSAGTLLRLELSPSRAPRLRHRLTAGAR